MSLSTAANTAQYLVILISLAAYVPQWLALLSTKNPQGISVRAWMLWLLSSFLSCFYAVALVIEGNAAYALVFTNVLTLTFVSITIALVLFRVRR